MFFNNVKLSTSDAFKAWYKNGLEAKKYFIIFNESLH